MTPRDAARLARDLMNQHGAGGWAFAFDRARRRFGCCQHRHHLITLSEPLTKLNSEAEVRDTILHEIAHALVGPGAGHGIKWRQQAALIGARPERCYSAKTVNTVTRPWMATCPKCSQVFHRFRRPRRLRWCLCALAGYDPALALVWRRNGAA